MTKDQVISWLTENLSVSRETIDKLECFEDFLRIEAEKQNLISKATIEDIWSRHFLDSAQLLSLVPEDKRHGTWVDLGSGAGFPGIVIALLSGFKVTLVESRARRIEYLERAIDTLDLIENTSVAGMRLELMDTEKFDVISARAFAPLPKLLDVAARFSTEKTLWLLPKGRNAVKELDEVQKQKKWRGKLMFHVKQSLTDVDAGIITGQLK